MLSGLTGGMPQHTKPQGSAWEDGDQDGVGACVVASEGSQG